ncbi:MAG TPA: peptidoglycan-binding protein [Candidatus Dormibacteraeota bacterium]|nr:peptidoglycan-binding protein [Candidatus Dormibacteraeota bacterium]
MKKLILATASVLALGIASSGIGHAADPYSSSTSTQSPYSSSTSTQTPRSSTMAPQSTQSATFPAATSETQVKQVQQQLKSAGLYRGTVDGKLGTDTQQAIERFQQKRGLPVTGTLDEQTMTALQGNTGRAGSSSITPAGRPSITGR